MTEETEVRRAQQPDAVTASTPALAQAFLQGALTSTLLRQATPASAGPAGRGPLFLSLFNCPSEPEPSGGGETTVRAFWWGFHVQISHDDLVRILDSADVVNSTVATIGGSIPSPAQPWIRLLAPFVAATHDGLRALDRGRGIYISMSWVTPGIFIPTSV